MPPLQPSCLQATFAAWSVQVRSQMCPHTSWQRISNRPHFLLPFSAFIIRSSMAGKSKLACKFLKTFQHHFFFRPSKYYGYHNIFIKHESQKKNRTLKWLIDVAIKIGIKVILCWSALFFQILDSKACRHSVTST